MSDVRPALTPEEWAHRPEPMYERNGVWAYAPAGHGFVVGFEGEVGIGVGAEDPHAIAALALHGQPFGFTWEDVSRNREAATRHRRLAKGCKLPHERDRHMEKAEGYDSTAARIAALLPPREP